MKSLTMMVLSSIVAFHAYVTAVRAQSFELIPNDTVETAGWLGDNFTLTIQQRNITNDTLYLRWSIVDKVVPAQWDASVCDNSFCYTTLVDSGSMSPVPPGENGMLYIRFTPQVIASRAVVRYAVWDEQQPEAKDTLTYILVAQSTTGVDATPSADVTIVLDRQTNAIRIDTFASDTFSAELYNLMGELIATSQNNKSNAVIAWDQAISGLYVLCVTSARHRHLFHLHL